MLTTAEAPTLALKVPPARPEKAMRDKGYSMRDMERLYAALQGWEEVRLEGDGSRPGFPYDLHPGERSMSEGSAWRGNWKVRLYERVQERGYDSLTAFAEARPSVPLVELAEELGEDDFTAAQFVQRVG